MKKITFLLCGLSLAILLFSCDKSKLCKCDEVMQTEYHSNPPNTTPELTVQGRVFYYIAEELEECSKFDNDREIIYTDKSTIIRTITCVED
ncbi:hypothetical protein LJC68_02485 [Bacteroidales bacterium OttesenSCG-928-B11]|nr:hypothetical protein [Bacteroidales bacterium OttesenSCG-928-C03]MDL2311729.1 hypothetical protein [Bacteroidales bacterium OttesenSCG-928-B11]MDL2325923.1 hypothetical protein [Bacteroidales bacterium OttesenSCG-928-A14]